MHNDMERKEMKMKNPLIKRLPRELKSDFGRYFVLFIFIAGTIALVSGFLVASGSMKVAYDESFEKYNIEDGNFELVQEADDNLIEILEEEEVTLYENFYLEKETEEFDSTLRIFKEREEVNKVCLMEGELPKKDDEIALDRMYADNNKLSVGDSLTVGGKELTVSGLVAFSDYSALFSSTSDMMFDAVKFGVGIMKEQGFEDFGEANLHYSYSWKYDTTPKDDTQAKEMSEDFMEVISENAILSNFIPQYSNQAIKFTGDDIGKDNVLMAYFLYIVVVIIAFIFAITTSNTITKEATVIGTLRASGYTRGELIRHYLTMPILVTLVSAVVGNVLGYTWFKDVAASIYYASYSLPTYVTIWNATAFIQTTVVPVILMFVINLCILAKKLKLSPLKFIRRDLSKRQKKKAFRLNTKIPIMRRFRLRIVFQNKSNYIMIIIGIFLANVILLFGMAFPPLLEKYQESITTNMISKYQYILKAPMETETEDAEKYTAYSLKTIEGRLKSEDVSVYGIESESQYIDVDFDEEGVYISTAFAEKFQINQGDKIKVKEEYEEKKYEFKVEGIYNYPAGIAIFMDRDDMNATFDMEEDYFNGYFSNEEIEDIEEEYIATKITVDDFTKVSRQMKLSMGGMMDAFAVFGVIMFMLIIYLLSRIIIEKNTQSISMTKILGYSEAEISSLYVVTTSIVVIASLILTIPLVNLLMEKVFVVMFSEYSGWMPYYVPFSAFIKMIVTGIVSYAVIAFGQFRKVKKIPLGIALKNVE